MRGSTTPDERLVILRRLLPATTVELADLRPSLWPRVLNGSGRGLSRHGKPRRPSQRRIARTLLRDLRRLGARRDADGVWRLS